MTGVILDTNVISEPKRPRPDPNVRAWFESQDPESLFLTSTVVAELALGIERVPLGRRRSDFERWLGTIVGQTFMGRILAFDTEAALLYGRLVFQAGKVGWSPTVGDAQIAAVALREGMAVATRDVHGFEPLGVEIINPWD